MDNFYNLGPGNEIHAVFSDPDLILNRQEIVESFVLLSGSGSVSSRYDRIDLSYAIEEYSGEIDHASAVYTPC